MCEFKPGDRVVRVISSHGLTYTFPWPSDEAANVIGVEATIRSITEPLPGIFGLFFEEFNTTAPAGFAADAWRKVQRRKTDLSIEAFSVIKDGGFEEPRKVPEKHKEKVQ